jgi:hypothetical protein
VEKTDADAAVRAKNNCHRSHRFGLKHRAAQIAAFFIAVLFLFGKSK